MQPENQYDPYEVSRLNNRIKHLEGQLSAAVGMVWTLREIYRREGLYEISDMIRDRMAEHKIVLRDEKITRT